MFGIANIKVRDLLLRENIILDRTLEITSRREVTTTREKEIDDFNDGSVYAVVGGRSPGG